MLGVVISVYIPSLFLSTKYNFLYSVCFDGNVSYDWGCNRYAQKHYSVVNGKLVENTIDPLQDSDGDKVPDIRENYSFRLFLHDTEKNESREVTPEEAYAMTFSGMLISPDGVTVSNERSHSVGVFPFFDGNYSEGMYLTKGKSKSSRLNLIYDQNGRSYYLDGFVFLGWVLPGRN